MWSGRFGVFCTTNSWMADCANRTLSVGGEAVDGIVDRLVLVCHDRRETKFLHHHGSKPLGNYRASARRILTRHHGGGEFPLPPNPPRRPTTPRGPRLPALRHSRRLRCGGSY
jgi:hypothetical protein